MRMSPHLEPDLKVLLCRGDPVHDERAPYAIA
ncbi:hypothetical protein BC2230_120183 [Burkholderia cepacia]